MLNLPNAVCYHCCTVHPPVNVLELKTKCKSLKELWIRLCKAGILKEFCFFFLIYQIVIIIL